jgi:hypothetical protein
MLFILSATRFLHLLALTHKDKLRRRTYGVEQLVRVNRRRNLSSKQEVLRYFYAENFRKTGKNQIKHKEFIFK